MPRSSSQMHQILSQAPVYNMPVARANVGKPFITPGTLNFLQMVVFLNFFRFYEAVF